MAEAFPIVNPAANLLGLGFTFAELPGSPVEDYTDDGFRATREFKVPWTNRGAFAIAMRGTATSTGGRTIITRPQVYPTFPKAAVNGCRCGPFTDRVTALGGDTTTATYDFAQVTVQYAAPKFDIDGPEGETYVTESLEPAAEFLTLSHEKLYWNNDQTNPLAETEAPQKLIRMCEWVYTINKVDKVPQATFSLIGYVNKNAITSRSLLVTFAAETLLYNPPRLSRSWTSDGNPTWTLEYRFTYRPEGWNRFYRRGVKDPSFIYTAAGVILDVYGLSTDFTDLLAGST